MFLPISIVLSVKPDLELRLDLPVILGHFQSNLPVASQYVFVPSTALFPSLDQFVIREFLFLSGHLEYARLVHCEGLYSGLEYGLILY